MQEGVKGRLKDMSLVDIIQVLTVGRKNAVISIGSEEGGVGKIWVERGNVVHAKTRDLSGKEALYNLLSWKEGEFEVEMDIAPAERTISGNVEALLMEGMKRFDETKRGGAEKEKLFGTGERESYHLIERLIQLGILVKKEG